MRLLTICLAFFVGLGSASFALAQGQSAPGNDSGTNPQANDRAGRFDAQRFVKDYDKNNDGKLSKDELPTQLQDGFADIDANKDDSLTTEELQQHSGRMSQRRPQIVEVLYYTVDIPTDDRMTVQELQQAYDFLRKMDANQNGKIEEEDIRAFRDQRVTERIGSVTKNLDRNNDGKISKDEARGFWSDDFARLDKNRDGNLDRDEIKAAFNVDQSGDGQQPNKTNNRPDGTQNRPPQPGNPGTTPPVK